MIHYGPYPPPPPGPYPAYTPPGYYPCARAPPQPITLINATFHQQGCQQSSSFLEGILSTIIFLVMFVFTLHIIMLLAMRPELPVFHVRSFTP